MGEPPAAPPIIRVTGRSSKVTVAAVAGASVDVRGGEVHHRDDGSLDVSDGRGREIKIICPPHTSLTISTASGTVSVGGEVGAVHVVTSSGRVEIEQAAELEVRTASGRVEVGRCHHRCRVTTQSGRIEVGASGGVELSSTSGRVTVDYVDDVAVRTVSGRIDLGVSAVANVRAHSISGRVAIRLDGESAARVDLRSTGGSIECKVPDGDGGAHIEVTTTSGSIEVGRR